MLALRFFPTNVENVRWPFIRYKVKINEIELYLYRRKNDWINTLMHRLDLKS